MRSRLGTLTGFAVVVVVGVVAFALFVVLRQTPNAFTLGVHSGAAVAPLKAGQTVCQAPIDVPSGGGFDRVRVRIGTYGHAGPAVALTVRDAHGATVASGRLPGGYPDITGAHPTHTIALDHRVAAGTTGLSVCLKDAGPGRLGVYGNGDAAAAGSTAKVDGKAIIGADVELVFERSSRSYASELGSILDRAVLFRSPRLSGALYFILLALLMAAAIGGIAVALRGVGDDAPPPPPSEPPADR
jgi:hypothetical protein